MYQIVRVYDDGATAAETAPSFVSALTACTIYLEDPSCIAIKIKDLRDNKTVMEYWAD